jgi:hypothetical protein
MDSPLFELALVLVRLDCVARPRRKRETQDHVNGCKLRWFSPRENPAPLPCHADFQDSTRESLAHALLRISLRQHAQFAR